MNHKTILALDLGTIKEHITDKGNANKYDVIDAVKSKGFSPNKI